jgi:hypothetical protein
MEKDVCSFKIKFYLAFKKTLKKSILLLRRLLTNLILKKQFLTSKMRVILFKRFYFRNKEKRNIN